MNESAVTTKIVHALNEHEFTHVEKRHSGKFQSGQPDITGCHRGFLFFIEMKMQDGDLTALQSSKLQTWRKSGAKTFLGVYNEFDRTLALIQPHHAEAWQEYAGKVKRLKLPSNILRTYDWKHWLEIEILGGNLL